MIDRFTQLVKAKYLKLRIRISKETAVKLVRFFVFLLIVYIIIPRPPLWEGMSWSSAYYDDNGKLLRLTTTGDEKFRLRTGLNKISPAAIEATLLYEDRYFYYHFGVNPYSIFRAFMETYVYKSRKIGASTITMQLARIRYNLKTDDLSGKIMQMVKALQLEVCYSKKEILAAYLSLAPYGKNIEGIGAASIIYFHKNPDQLSALEALTLSVIPQNPVKNAPDSDEKNINSNNDLLQARLRLYNIWIKSHPEDKKKKDIFHKPITVFKRKDLPFYAPHFITQAQEKIVRSGQIETTLDLRIQNIISTKLKTYVERNRYRGIENGSVILLNYKTMEVKSLVGSADFFNDDIHGQVDGSQGKRSPGSTLKPFVYGLALDQGLIHSESVLKDSPIGFGSFSPENYDGQFKGPVAATDALINSRNVPAAYLASKISNPDLYGLLQRAGVKKMQARSHYGLSIVLGGVEVTMEELAALYAMLANKGVLKSVKIEKTKDGKPGKGDEAAENGGKRLLSKEASYIVLKMLAQNPRPGNRLSTDWIRNDLPVYWKTGTSYGFKDAWAAGIFGPYVLIVWIGNFDGSGNPAFVGRGIAGRLFFQIVEAVKLVAGPLQDDQSRKDLNVKSISVCAASGGLPGPHCPSTRQAWFIPGKSPIQPDTVYREVMIDPKTGLRACRPDQPGAYAQVFEFWPSDLLKIFQMAGVPRRSPPPYDPNCEKFAQGQSPEIVSPRRHLDYTASKDDQRSQIPFSAVSDADVSTLYWFVDTSYVGQSKRGEPFFWRAVPGNYMVRVVDNQGRFDARPLHVVQED